MSILESAKTELAAVNFGDEDSKAMIEILEKFFDRWDSGGAVSVAQDVLNRLISGQPLSPLTGKDDEWVIHDFAPHLYAQNKRCGTVFKDRSGVAYDMNADGTRYIISFPYLPGTKMAEMPIYEVQGA